MQGFLFDDLDSYEEDAGYRKELIRRLKVAKAVEGRTVTITSNKTVEKILINSLGKLDSIREIVCTEYEGLGKELRLLVLTDYIRKEYQDVIGRTDRKIEKIGVLPKEAEGYLEKMLQGKHCQFSAVEFCDVEGAGLGYIQVNIKGKKQDWGRGGIPFYGFIFI